MIKFWLNVYCRNINKFILSRKKIVTLCQLSNVQFLNDFAYVSRCLLVALFNFGFSLNDRSCSLPHSDFCRCFLNSKKCPGYLVQLSTVLKNFSFYFCANTVNFYYNVVKKYLTFHIVQLCLELNFHSNWFFLYYYY